MAVSGKNRTFAPSKHRKFQKLKDNKPSRRAARQHTWRAFFILGGSGIFVHYRLFRLNRFFIGVNEYDSYEMLTGHLQKRVDSIAQ
ncbi:hypothetical protein CIK90_03855 [Prevotella sp. P5-126]|nr:hypothetical protein CIK90_03855 [Prevotella sp. P5-126]